MDGNARERHWAGVDQEKDSLLPMIVVEKDLLVGSNSNTVSLRIVSMHLCASSDHFLILDFKFPSPALGKYSGGAGHRLSCMWPMALETLTNSHVG